MQVYYHNGATDTETVATLSGAGLDVAIPDGEMSDEDLQEVVMASDSVLLPVGYDPWSGFIVGLAMAFGKTVYAYEVLGDATFSFQGYQHFNSLELAVKSLLEDHNGNHELERGGPSPGGDTSPGGDPSDAPGT